MRVRSISRQAEEDYRGPRIALPYSLPHFTEPDLATEVEAMFASDSSSHLIEPSELAGMTVRPNGRVPGRVVSGRPPKSYDPSKAVDLSEQGLVCRVPGYEGQEIADEDPDCVEDMVGICVNRIFH